MAVRASKQRQHAATRRSWRIALYVVLAVVCVTHLTLLQAWYTNSQASLLAKEQALNQPPVRINLGDERLLAPAFASSNPSSVWFMTNKSHPIHPSQYTPTDLTPAPLPMQPELSGETTHVRGTVAGALTRLEKAASADGIHLMLNSAYRSHQLQQELHSEAASSLYDTGTRTAPAGTSEHQLGLAVDFSSNTPACRDAGYCAISDPDAAWLANHAHVYGFILRYPKGKEDITGYQFEPWHYRYVGRPLATALHSSGLTLDEAWPKLQAAEKELRARGDI